MCVMAMIIPEDLVGGTFASGVRSNFSKWAFILDFVVHDDRATAEDFLVVSRMRLDPSCVQQLLAVLSGQLDQYEQKFGDPRLAGGEPPENAAAD
jgi:hypothetical protein